MGQRSGASLGWPLLAVLAWLAVLVGAMTPVTGHGLLTLATSTAAVVVWVRVATRSANRGAWSCFAVGLTGYAAGYAVLFHASGLQRFGPGVLNLSDCLSLLLFPGVLGGTALLMRDGLAGQRFGAVLDGGTVVPAVGAVLLQWTAYEYPQLATAPTMQVALTIVYPVAVSALAVSVVAGVINTQCRVDAQWLWLILGLSTMSVAELLFTSRVAAGTFTFGTVLDAAFAAGPLGVALAAWTSPRPPPPKDAVRSVTGMIVPALSTVAALVVLVDRRDYVPGSAIVLAVVTVVFAVLRTTLFVRQEQVLAQRTLESRTDPLTGLLNRRALLSTLAARLSGPEATTLVLVDLDRFKEVNDSLGHHVGDGLLVQMGGRLEDQAPDGAVVARLGGDEFAVVIPGSMAGAAGLGARLVEALEQTAQIGEHRVTVGASLGLADSPAGPDGLDAFELMRRADVALYRSKRERTGVEAWHPGLDLGARERLTLVADLRTALDEDEQLVVHLQPKHDARTRAVVGFEALVRWQHPARGLLGPGEFLPAIERAGLLARLTERVLELVLVESTALRRAGRPLPIAVNVSAPDLLDVRFAARVEAALERHRLPASAIRMEITETVVMTDPARVLTTLGQLRRLGIRLSLDDYGTGLSSLSYLRTLPVDELKVDRTFVARVTTDEASSLIVRSTITLAHGLGLTVVAEGVEDVATLEALAAADCDVVQGYLLGRPVPACDLVWPVALAVPTLVR